MKIQLTLLLSSLLILMSAGCDYTSGVHREILIAQEHVTNHNYAKAAVFYERVLKMNPTKSIRYKVNFQLAEIYYLYLNEQVKSLHYYQSLLDEIDDPIWHVKALEKIAEINFSFARNFDQSIKAYKKLLMFKPKLTNFDFYFFRIGQSYFESKDFEKSESVFQSIKNNTNHTFHIESFYYLGQIKFFEQKWSESIEYWLEYIKREKQKDKIIQTKFLIANAYESDEKLKEAYNIYYSLLDSYPNPQIIKNRLKSVFDRRTARKR